VHLDHPPKLQPGETWEQRQQRLREEFEPQQRRHSLAVVAELARVQRMRAWQQKGVSSATDVNRFVRTVTSRSWIRHVVRLLTGLYAGWLT
jgi:hypothetical protein